MNIDSLLLRIVLIVLCCARAAFAEAAKPNIIFILADDIGLPGFGCTGGIYKTPNIDALAAGGTRFEYCFAAPLCAPSRAMLMTGRYAFRTGVKSNGLGAEATPQKDGCVAQLMKQAGYATASRFFFLPSTSPSSGSPAPQIKNSSKPHFAPSSFVAK